MKDFKLPEESVDGSITWKGAGDRRSDFLLEDKTDLWETAMLARCVIKIENEPATLSFDDWMTQDRRNEVGQGTQFRNPRSS